MKCRICLPFLKIDFFEDLCLFHDPLSTSNLVWPMKGFQYIQIPKNQAEEESLQIPFYESKWRTQYLILLSKSFSKSMILSQFVKTCQPFILKLFHRLFPSKISMVERSKLLPTSHVFSSFQFEIENQDRVLSLLDEFSQIIDSNWEWKLCLSCQFSSW
mgnify:FL=1